LTTYKQKSTFLQSKISSSFLWDVLWSLSELATVTREGKVYNNKKKVVSKLDLVLDFGYKIWYSQD